jgi:hypothetical protein
MGRLLEGMAWNECAMSWKIFNFIVYIHEINPNTVTRNINAVTSNIQSVFTEPFEHI